MGGTEKRAGQTNILKRRGKLGQGVGALKKGGEEVWKPLTNDGVIHPNLRDSDV